jgi:hypothetical protein
MLRLPDNAGQTDRRGNPREREMPRPATKMHVREQDATVLLDPVRIELNRLTVRLDHYLAKMKLDEAGVAALTRAREVVSQAAETVADIEAGSTKS